MISAKRIELTFPTTDRGERCTKYTRCTEGYGRFEVTPTKIAELIEEVHIEGVGGEVQKMMEEVALFDIDSGGGWEKLGLIT